jgi:predicted metal-dependent enzyme (double-stranded beta helix superfamily)
VQEVVRRAGSTPGAVLQALGEPQRAAIQTLCRSYDLTVLNVIWAPWMNLLPHNHRMWAIIGCTLDAKITSSGDAFRETTAWSACEQNCS